MSIFQRALNIFQRKEEKERKYGPFQEGMERAAVIASAATGKEITARDMYLCLVALKLSRHSYSDHEDSVLDAMVYLGQMVESNKHKYNEKTDGLLHEELDNLRS